MSNKATKNSQVNARFQEKWFPMPHIIGTSSCTVASQDTCCRRPSKYRRFIGEQIVDQLIDRLPDHSVCRNPVPGPLHRGRNLIIGERTCGKNPMRWHWQAGLCHYARGGGATLITHQSCLLYHHIVVETGPTSKSTKLEIRIMGR